MTSLGSFGTKRPDYDFDYLGTKIRVNPRLSHLTMARVGATANVTAESTPDEVEAGMRVMFGGVVHPDDLDTMYALWEANGLDVDEALEIVQQVYAAVADRPTERPSSSPAGQPRTRRKSADGSSLRVQRDYEKKGRGDLALVVKMAREEKEARSA